MPGGLKNWQWRWGWTIARSDGARERGGAGLAVSARRCVPGVLRLCRGHLPRAAQPAEGRGEWRFGRAQRGGADRGRAGAGMASLPAHFYNAGMG